MSTAAAAPCVDAAAEEVARELRTLLGGDGEVRALQRLTGGATKATWSFDWVRGGRCEPLILQQTAASPAPSGGAPKLGAAHEAALMQAARAGGVPAPRVRHVLDASRPLGPGHVTERVDGETLGRRIVHGDAFAAARGRLAAQCGAALAAIHRLPAASLPFLPALAPADELRIYTGLLGGLERSHPALAWAVRWVREHLPERVPPRVVHADFRTGNLVVGADGLRCVLDWEIARLGDPMQDLGVLCMRTWRFGGAQPVGGFGRRDELVAAYEAAGGGPVDPARVRFWEAFSNLKWAIACVRRGQATRADGRPASVEMAAIGRRLEEPLWDFMNLALDARAP